MKLTVLKSELKKLPLEIRSFLKRIILIFIVWKLAYFFIIKPNRFLDVPLTNLVAKNSIFILQNIYKDSYFEVQKTPVLNQQDFYNVKILKNSKKVIGISDPCNALELIILYISFIFALPQKFSRIFLFSIVGIFLIHILNIARVVTLTYLNIIKNINVDIAHHYVFKVIIYIFIFGGWYLYLNRKPKNDEL